MGHVGALCPNRPGFCPAFGIDQWFQWTLHNRDILSQNESLNPIRGQTFVSKKNPHGPVGAIFSGLALATQTDRTRGIRFRGLLPALVTFVTFTRARGTTLRPVKLGACPAKRSKFANASEGRALTCTVAFTCARGSSKSFVANLFLNLNSVVMRAATPMPTDVVSRARVFLNP
jgi:hypothetical protein